MEFPTLRIEVLERNAAVVLGLSGGVLCWVCGRAEWWSVMLKLC